MIKKLTLIIIFILVAVMASAETYTVKKGDNLTSIAKKYGITVTELIKTNNIQNPNKVTVGTKLRIPEKKQSKATASTQTKQTSTQNSDKKEVKYTTYTVKKGDTLATIAGKYKTTVKDIMSVNKINNANKIRVGQKLKVPGGTVVATSSSSSKTSTAVVSSSKASTAVVSSSKASTAVVSSAKTSTPATSEKKSSVAVNPSSNPYFWPVEGVQQPIEGKLKGTVISTPSSSIIRSVSTGKVIWEGQYRGMGRVVMVESNSGYIYVYGGNENTLVKLGDRVAPGSEIGIPSACGVAGKSNVYFSVYKDGNPVDEKKAPRV